MDPEIFILGVPPVNVMNGDQTYMLRILLMIARKTTTKWEESTLTKYRLNSNVLIINIIVTETLIKLK